MATKKFLDETGLQELVKHIPVLRAGSGITLTQPDANNPNIVLLTSTASGGSTKIWIGTQAEFTDTVKSSLSKDTLVVFTDDNTATAIEAKDVECTSAVYGSGSATNKVQTALTNLAAGVSSANQNYTFLTNIVNNNIMGCADYSSSYSYSVNECCKYYNAVYKCIKDCQGEVPFTPVVGGASGAGTVNTEYWKKVTLADLTTNVDGNTSSGTNVVILTQDEYDALGTSTASDNKLYIVKQKIEYTFDIEVLYSTSATNIYYKNQDYGNYIEHDSIIRQQFGDGISSMSAIGPYEEGFSVVNKLDATSDLSDDYVYNLDASGAATITNTDQLNAIYNSYKTTFVPLTECTLKLTFSCYRWE